MKLAEGVTFRRKEGYMAKPTLDQRSPNSTRLEKEKEKIKGSALGYYSILAVAFFSGGVVLLLEILGTRILAPHLGTSFSVWVNVIGVILAALSLGYYMGGILADRNPKLLPVILLASACGCALVYFEKPLVSDFGKLGLEWGSLLAALLLFAPPGTVLAMVSPYLIKIAAADPTRIGRASGSIYAASTAGSIAGTFLGGFWLIPHFPATSILLGMVVVLLLLSAWSARTVKPSWAIVVLCLIVVAGVEALATPAGDWSSSNISHVFEKNSRYFNIRVNDSGGTSRFLLLDGSLQSGRDLTSTKILFPYVDLSARVIQSLKPAPQSALIVGGGGYSIPEFIKKNAPQADVTVVEIDPDVTAIAKWFFLRDPAMPITTLNEDGRVFLNCNQRQFDVMYTDAYSNGGSIPPHLATREAFYRMSRALKPDGVVVFNIGSARTGRYAKVYESLFTTIQSVFPRTATFCTLPSDPDKIQNLIVVATNTNPLSEDILHPLEASRCRDVPAPGLLLTDNYAPIDYLSQDIIRKIYPEERQVQ
jgi:spermidine synthase